MNKTEKATKDYWLDVDRHLAELPLDVSLELDPFYSEPNWQVYRLRYNSLGGYRLFSWLSVPYGAGPFPAMVRMPDYGSVHDLVYTPLRRQAIVMNPTFRGQRHSDGTHEASFPGLLTDGIENLGSFTMPLVFADGIRAIDAISTLEHFNGQAAVTGAGLGGALSLLAASLRTCVKCVAADTPLMLGNPAALDQATAYPLAELSDYLRIHPHRRELLLDITSPMDPLKTASEIPVPVLLSVGTRDRGQCLPELGKSLANALPYCDLRVYDGGSEGGGHEHAVVRGQWIRNRLGLD